jgi:hypothetical protein
VLPDGTFPNITIVEAMLNCIDSLNISTENIEGTGLGKVIQMYAEGIAKMPPVRQIAN